MANQSVLILLCLLLLYQQFHLIECQINEDSIYFFGDTGFLKDHWLRIGCYFFNASMEIEWIFPKSSTARVENRFNITIMADVNSILIVSHLTMSDAGQYTCRLKKKPSVHNTTNLYIIGQDELPVRPFLFVRPDEKLAYGGKLIISCFTKIYQDFYNLTWFLPQSSRAKFENRLELVFITYDALIELRLIVRNLTESDKGIYECFNTNRINKLTNYWSVTKDKLYDKVVFLADAFVAPGKTLLLDCKVKDVKYEQINYFFSKCDWNRTYTFPEGSNCSEWNLIKPISVRSNKTSTIDDTKSKQFFKPSAPGRIKCEVETTEDIYETNVTANLYVQEKPKSLLIESSPKQVFSGNKTVIQCSASMYIFNESVNMYRNGKLLTEKNTLNGTFFKKSKTEFMYVNILTTEHIKPQDAGRFKCVAMTFKDGVQETTFDLKVNDPPMFISQTGNETEVYDVQLNSQLVLTCGVVGFPVPSVKWFKNDKLTESNGLIFTNSTMLLIERTLDEDTANYKCEAVNTFGQITKHFIVKVYHTGLSKTLITTCILILVLALVCISLVTYGFYRREHNKRLALQRAGISYFIEGNEQEINNDISIMEQADLLPYDTRYDFPKKNISLGQQIGVGAFGEVLIGEALGIRKEEPTTTVAVKRVRNAASNEDIKALISELKIMIYLGKHLNVLHLLGVVHENLTKRELLVITEFCPFGNLRDYVRKYQATNIDQNEVIYENVIVTTTSDRGLLDQSMTGLPSVSHLQDTIKESKLICWSFQVAQGMNFLARRGVLHGDLAARNLLLTHDDVVKIADFGFSRPMRMDEDYEKHTEMALPLKWMAIESIEDKIFNSSTDVWAFGVTMWELFSLGQEPYKHIASYDLLTQLRFGFRLAQPRFASNAIYKLMEDCWNVIPTERPRFSTLCTRLSHFLPKPIMEKYHDISTDYVEINVAVENKAYGLQNEIAHPDYPAPNNECFEMVPINLKV